MQPQAQTSTAWRSWLLLILSSIGAVLSFTGGALLLAIGGAALVSLPIPSLNTQSMFNFAWVMLLVGALCLPAVVYSWLEVRGTPASARTSRKLFLASSAGMLLWVLLLISFETVETSQLAWLLLPPLVLLTAVLPLWWYIETGRRGLLSDPPARTWGIEGFFRPC